MPRRAPPVPSVPVDREPSFDLDAHLFYWMTQVMGRRDRQIATALKPYGLRVAEWRVLATLRSRRGAPMSELAEHTTIDRTTLSRTVDRMVRSGWLARLADANDMRVTRLALSAKGEKLFAAIWPVVDGLNRQATANLPAGTADLVRWALAQMRANLDAGAASDAARGAA